MIGMAVGLGDRHLENILVDSTTGSVMHVDFGCLFDHGLNLETPERVPFRLTQNILHTMGPCGGTDGVFRRVCELTLEQLRHHREPLLNVLSTMRHDPLVEWNKRNAREDASGREDSEEANKELEKIDAKLGGVLEAGGARSRCRGRCSSSSMTRPTLTTSRRCSFGGCRGADRALRTLLYVYTHARCLVCAQAAARARRGY